MDQESKIAILEQKNRHFEEKFSNIYEQITELRTSIQQLYSESSKNNRIAFAEMLELSKRIEALASSGNSTRSSSTTVNFSPQTNNEMNQNPTSTISSGSSPATEKSKGFFGINFDNMITVGIAAVIGFMVLIGVISMFFFKLSSVLGTMFN